MTPSDAHNRGPMPLTAANRLPLRALVPAKINLGLFVGPKRSDGRHELVSVMQSISLADELTLERASTGASADEIVCPGAPELAGAQNLAARALAAFRVQTGWDPGPLRLTIAKRVPVAAGMGGGSGDAAAALRLAAHACGLEDRALLQALACKLGADVPAQVAPGRWLALGAGEQLQPLPDPTRPFGVLVLPLAQGLSTAAVYAEADRLGITRGSEELRARCEQLQRSALTDGAQLPPHTLLVNDLQQAAISLCPQIEAVLEQAREAGADVALVSGSGPTVLGLFPGGDGPVRARDAADRVGERDPRPIAAVPVNSMVVRVVEVRNNERLNPRQ
jgi:4-diphosphocytidyl-2-C-methyl-D-erythritol kinase